MFFTVFGKKNCPYCTRAVELLDSEKKEFIYKDVGTNNDLLTEMRDAVHGATGKYPETVPQIFVDDQHIGGYTELVAYFEQNDEVVDTRDFDFEL